MNCALVCLWNKTGNYRVGCNVAHSGGNSYRADKMLLFVGIQYSCSYLWLIYLLLGW